MLTDLIKKNTTDDTLGLILNRCDRCGKFVNLLDDKVDVNFIPDSPFTVEHHDILCGKCKIEVAALFTPPEKKYLTLAQIEQLRAHIHTAQMAGDANEQIRALAAAQRILQLVEK